MSMASMKGFGMGVPAGARKTRKAHYAGTECRGGRKGETEKGMQLSASREVCEVAAERRRPPASVAGTDGPPLPSWKRKASLKTAWKSGVHAADRQKARE